MPFAPRRTVLGVWIALTGCAADGGGLTEATACTRPTIAHDSLSANPANVLSGVGAVDVRQADSVIVRYDVDASLDSATPAFMARPDDALVPTLVLGLFPQTTYHAQATAFNRCGATAGRVLTFTTGTLPVDLPTFSASGPSPSPGYVAFGAGSYGVVIDNVGRVVWYHRFERGVGLNFQPQPNGRYATRPPVDAGDVATWMEIDARGTITRRLACARGLQARMHDMIAQPDGSYWLLCDETRVMNLSAQGQSPATAVMGTSVHHRSPSGSLLYEWSAFDHLDVVLADLEPSDRVGATINWTHGNALDLDESGDLLVSFRNISQVVKVDTHTGAVLWRLGGTAGALPLENAGAPAFSRQHGVRASAGGIVLLDNLGERTGSRVERYAIDELQRTARLTASYTSPTRTIAQLGGSAQSDRSGRTLVSFGSGGAVEEYDANGNLAWRIDGSPGYIFRAHRIRSLYQPGAGDPR